MVSETLEQLLKLPANERVELALALWESLADVDREDASPISDEHVADLEPALPPDVVDRSLGVGGRGIAEERA
jgi:hypothetical protein